MDRRMDGWIDKLIERKKDRNNEKKCIEMDKFIAS